MADKFSAVSSFSRIRMSITSKTLLAFILIISVLAGCLYYFTSVVYPTELEKDALSTLHTKFNGAWRLYHSRMEQMKLGMLQAGSEPHVKDAIRRRDGALLRKLLTGYSSFRPYVDFWAVVDDRQTVIGRRNGAAGDYFEVKGIVSRALKTGEASLSTEPVTKELLARESNELASRIESAGLMQFAVVPVEHGGRVIGAFVTGILLNRNQWLPDVVYENFGISLAVFDRGDQEARVIASMSSPRAVLGKFDLMPEGAEETVKNGKEFLGSVELNGNRVFLIAEPILDAEGRVIGSLAAAVNSSETGQYIEAIEDNILIAIFAGVVFSLILASIVYRDTVRPIRALTAAMDETAKGNLDVRADIRTRDDFEKIGEGFNSMVDSIRVREQRLDRFNELSKVLIEFTDPDILIDKALLKLIELTGSDLGAVYLHDGDAGMLRPAVAYGVGGAELKSLRVGEGLAGRCACQKKTVVLENITDANLTIETGFSKLTPAGLVWFAMTYKGKLNGVLAIGSVRPYKKDEIRHIEHLVTQLAIALDNAFTHREVENLSITDQLTGLYNRRRFTELLEGEFAGALRYRYNIAVLMIDIDDFKSINDTFGHQLGDKVLTEVGRILRDKTRRTDVWARYGGEEFIGLISHCNMDGIMTLAEKIRKHTEETEFPGLLGRKVTLSIGIGCYPAEHITDTNDLIKSADDCLYKAKANGKNTIVVQDMSPKMRMVEGA